MMLRKYPLVTERVPHYQDVCSRGKHKYKNRLSNDVINFHPQNNITAEWFEWINLQNISKVGVSGTV